MQAAVAATRACLLPLRPIVAPGNRAHAVTAMHVSRPAIRRRASAPRIVAALPGSDALQLDGRVKEELPQWLSLVGYAAAVLVERARLASFSVTWPLIGATLAWYTLIWGALKLAGAAKGDDAIGGTIGPVYLATTALNGFSRVTPYETAALLFGYQMIGFLPAFAYSKYVWLGTLVLAIYKGLPAQWLVAAYGVSAAWRFLTQYQDTRVVRYSSLAFVALAGWAFYARAEMSVSLFLMLGSIVSSAIA